VERKLKSRNVKVNTDVATARPPSGSAPGSRPTNAVSTTALARNILLSVLRACELAALLVPNPGGRSPRRWLRRAAPVALGGDGVGGWAFRDSDAQLLRRLWLCRLRCRLNTLHVKNGTIEIPIHKLPIVR
jgi:hypothetical protein